MTLKKILPPMALLGSTAFMVAMFLPAKAAQVQPYIEGGDIYSVRNVTKGGSFSDPTTADKCDTLQYRVRIHNPGPDQVLNNVVVKASFSGGASTQNVSTVVASASNAEPASRTDTATVNLSSAQTVTYVPGSTQLLNAQGGVIGTIGDVTSGSGVNIGTVGISINEKRFVQFNAKINCPQTPPPTKDFKCKSLNATMVDRTHYTVTVLAQVQNVTVQKYRFEVKNKAGTVVDDKTVTTNAQSANYSFNQSSSDTYTVTAIITTDAGATNPAECMVQITVTPEGTPPPNPTTPSNTTINNDTTNNNNINNNSSVSTVGSSGVLGSSSALPDTGPGDVVAFAGILTFVSSLAYYIVMPKISKLL